MKVLLSWLREYADVAATAEEVAVRMGVRGFAVEGIDPLGDGDAVLDFEVTANRPDCMSVAGIAREVATAYGVELRAAGPARLTQGSPEPALQDSRSAGPAAGGPAVQISIDNPDLCTRYAGQVAEVRVGPSPDWMQARLKAAGVRPISNIVDITAYVMLELGQPMHAFDYETIGGRQIRVRTAREGETLRTLDNQLRTLAPEMLVIADAERAVAVAGVMGGAETEVTDRTQTVLFESAYFNPLSVRRTSRRLGLKTEASMRFERGSDPDLPVRAMARAAELLGAIAAGRISGPMLDRHVAPATPRRLPLRRARIAGLLGVDVPATDVVRILTSLGFSVADAEGGWEVTVPTRRVDVVRDVDLIEEVARHYGFDRIPSHFPAVVVAPRPSDPRVTQARGLRALMTGAGFSEAVTFGFIGEQAAAPFAAEGDLVAIANPLSENFAVLRPTALPGLLAAVAHNRRREQGDVRLFEVGNRFSRSAGERRSLACAWAGSTGGEHWAGGTRPVDFFDIKGVVERTCRALGHDVQAQPADVPWLTPGRSAAAHVGTAPVAHFGQVTPAIAEQHGLPAGDSVYVAEIDLEALDALGAAERLRVTPLPRFPSVTRDISIVIDEAAAAADIRRTIADAAPPTLVRVSEFDRYQGTGIPEGRISLSLRLTFRAPERTLTDAEVQSAMDAVLTALRTAHNAVQR